MFAIDPYDAEIETFHGENITSKWSPCRVIGVTFEDGAPVYVVEMTGVLNCLATATYIRKPEPFYPRRRSA